MRDFRKEDIAKSECVDKADKKVLDQEARLAAMKPDDPERPAAERLLRQMRENASEAGLNRAFERYNETGD